MGFVDREETKGSLLPAAKLNRRLRAEEVYPLLSPIYKKVAPLSTIWAQHGPEIDFKR